MLTHTVTHFHIQLQPARPTAWPHFAGSALRGAFGRALRRAACITGQSTCQGCPLRRSCAYGVVFDPAPPAQPLHPSFRDGQPLYLIRPPALGACQLHAGQLQNYTLILLPGSQTHHGLVQHILKAAADQELQTPGSFQLHSVTSETVTLYNCAAPTAMPANTPPVLPHSTPVKQSAVSTLRWHTPLRIQQQGKPIFKGNQLDATTLVRAMLRRRVQWHQITAQATPDNNPELQAASQCQLDTRNLQWHDISRYSGAQNQHLPLGGLVGSATLNGPASALQTLQPLMQLGEQLHIGKEAIMGLGRYQLSKLQIS